MRTQAGFISGSVAGMRKEHKIICLDWAEGVWLNDRCHTRREKIPFLERVPPSHIF